MTKIDIRLLLAVLAVLLSAGAQAQRKNTRYVEYINTYKDLAIEQMKQYRIPASITLAQGLLESGAGMSDLARKSNNHFGIKCNNGWTGRTVHHDDDARGECFRAYSHPRDSYRDHSLFLRNGSRYAFLFKLSITDYRGWAQGLKRAGYATDPSYANRLITIIEDYELYKYDRHSSGSSSSKQTTYSKKQLAKKPWLTNPHQVHIANDIAYVVARQGDSFELIGKEIGISGKKLARYNDLDRDYTLQAGDIVYLKEKRKQAAKQFTVHIVRSGDSMHSISQRYGIRLKSLYKMNKKDGDYVPEIGDRLRVR
jgi:LysM repeat protein